MLSTRVWTMIFIANGMPRSGSILQYNLARVMLETATDRRRTVIGSGTLRERPREDRQTLRDAAESDVWSVVHAHELRHLALFFQRVSVLGTLQAARSGAVVIGHTFRDLRDVGASIKCFYGRRRTDSLSDLAPAVKYHQWLCAFRNEPWMLFQRYEDVIVDLPAAAREIAALLGIEDDAAVDAAARECRMDEALSRQSMLHQRAHDAGFATENPESFDPLPAVMASSRATLDEQDRFGIRDRKTQMLLHHISPRKGRPGSWREALTGDEVRRIERRYRDYLQVEGYELTVPDGPEPSGPSV